MTTARDNLLIRWATRWDRAGVTALLAQVAALHDTPTDPDDLETAFEHALRNPDEARFCVAERDRQVVGIAGLHRAYSTWRGRPYGTIEDVFVVEGERRNGVATAMFDFLIEQAGRRGYCMVTLEVKADNEAARAFYERYGFADSGYVVYEMHSTLDADEAER